MASDELIQQSVNVSLMVTSIALTLLILYTMPTKTVNTTTKSIEQANAFTKITTAGTTTTHTTSTITIATSITTKATLVTTTETSITTTPTSNTTTSSSVTTIVTTINTPATTITTTATTITTSTTAFASTVANTMTTTTTTSKGQKLMVITGATDASPLGISDVEIIDLGTTLTTCAPIPSYPMQLRTSIGGLVNASTLLVCSGTFSQATNICFYYQNGVWIPGPTMLTAGHNFASMPLSPFNVPSHRFYVADWANGQVLIGESWTQSNIPPLPASFYSACIVEFNNSSVFIIGGQNTMTNTYKFDSVTSSWIGGPTLQVGRMGHSCGRILTTSSNNYFSIIAVGGFAPGYISLSSVEILDSPTSSWRSGPSLPIEIGAAGLVSDPLGGVVLAGGYDINGKSLSSIYQLNSGDSSSTWVLMKQVLKTARYWPVTVMVPDEMTTCN